MPLSLKGICVGFVLLLVAFRAIEFLRPRARRLPILRRGFRTDLAYWVCTPLVTRAVVRIAVLIAAVPVALLAYGKLDRDLIQHGFGPAAGVPLWLQAIAILLISDAAGYWMHRGFHGRRLWRFHAVHHSSQDLDWLAAVRVHPLNDVTMRLATTIPVLALGFSPLAVAGIVPVLTLFAILLHANIDWDWGPLRAVIASPRFHRWHHTDEAAARDRNFAGLFPIWDLLWGTYHMPRGRLPSTFGTSTEVPPGLLAQLAFPFRRR
jgi:sterol desaturase/sphingolipid hydroxylase (fatty acid hydroxylase superfamily)